MRDWRYPSVDAVIRFNQIETRSPQSAVADRGGIDAALSRARASFDGYDLFPYVWEKAAVILHGLSTTQYFLDGNKRTAWVTARVFLLGNGENLVEIPTDEAEEFVLGVVDGQIDVPEIANWLFARAVRLVETLRDDGTCALCLEERSLVGVELLPRDWMRRVSWRERGTLAETWDEGVSNYDVRRFDPSKDLVPSVCERCANGWIAQIEDPARELLFDRSAQGRMHLTQAEALTLANWMVKFALLRSVQEHPVLNGWRASEAQRLRDSRAPSKHWRVFGAIRETSHWDGGRFSFAAVELRTSPAEPSIFVQVTLKFAGLVLIAIYQPPEGTKFCDLCEEFELDLESDLLIDLLADIGSQQLPDCDSERASELAGRAQRRFLTLRGE